MIKFKSIGYSLRKYSLFIAGVILVLQGVFIYNSFQQNPEQDASAFLTQSLDSITPGAIVASESGVLEVRGQNIKGPDITHVSVGANHTCLLMEAIIRDVKCFGENSTGVLGTGNFADSGLGSSNGDIQNLPVINFGTLSNGQRPNPKLIDAGRYNTCAVFDTNEIKCWGRNSYEIGGGGLSVNVEVGLIGNDNTGNFNNPAAVPFIDITNDTTFVGAVVKMNPNEQIIDIVVGEEHACIATDQIRIGCWGRNSLGQTHMTNVGDGATDKSVYPILKDVSGLLNNNSIIKLETHDRNTCAMSIDRLSCWGDGEFGVPLIGSGLDVGTEEDGFIPSIDRISHAVSPNYSFADIAVGRREACAIENHNNNTDPNRVKCWGRTTFTDTGTGYGQSSGEDYANAPVVPFKAGFSPEKITLESARACSIGSQTGDPQTNIVCWGLNSNGKHGVGNSANPPGYYISGGAFRDAPDDNPYSGLTSANKKFGDVRQVITLDTYDDHTCVNSEQTSNVFSGVFCWGKGDSGQLGFTPTVGSNHGDGSDEYVFNAQELVATPLPNIVIDNGSGAADDQACTNFGGHYRWDSTNQEIYIECYIDPTTNSYTGTNTFRIERASGDDATINFSSTDPFVTSGQDFLDSTIVCDSYLTNWTVSCTLTPKTGFAFPDGITLKLEDTETLSAQRQSQTSGGNCPSGNATDEVIECTNIPYYPVEGFNGPLQLKADVTVANSSGFETIINPNLEPAETPTRAFAREVTASDVGPSFNCNDTPTQFGGVIPACYVQLSSTLYNYNTLAGKDFRVSFDGVASESQACYIRRNGNDSDGGPGYSAFLRCDNIPTANSGEAYVSPRTAQLYIDDVATGLSDEVHLTFLEPLISPLNATDVPTINYSCDQVAPRVNTTCTFDLPVNKTLPTDTRMIVYESQSYADETIGGECSVSGQTVTCVDVPVQDVSNNSPYFLRIGVYLESSDTVVNTTQTMLYRDPTIIDIANIQSGNCTPTSINSGENVDCTFNLQGDANDYYVASGQMTANFENNLLTSANCSVSGATVICDNVDSTGAPIGVGRVRLKRGDGFDLGSTSDVNIASRQITATEAAALTPVCDNGLPTQTTTCTFELAENIALPAAFEIKADFYINGIGIPWTDGGCVRAGTTITCDAVNIEPNYELSQIPVMVRLINDDDAYIETQGSVNVIPPTVLSTSGNNFNANNSCVEGSRGDVTICTFDLQGDTNNFYKLDVANPVTIQVSDGSVSSNCSLEDNVLGTARITCINVPLDVTNTGENSVSLRLGSDEVATTTVNLLEDRDLLDSSNISQITDFACVTTKINTPTTCTFTLPDNITINGDERLSMGQGIDFNTLTPACELDLTTRVATCLQSKVGQNKDLNAPINILYSGGAIGGTGATGIIDIDTDEDNILDEQDTDDDNDGLSDVDEATQGTQPLDPDSDNDGLSDGDEVNIHLSDPLKIDTDEDGLNDGDEVNDHGSSPIKKDTDDDGLEDGEEVALGTEPDNEDSDGDTLTDGAEVNNHNSDPLKTDTDNDGVDDNVEVLDGTDVRDGDSDDDGYTDLQEKTAGTNPLDDTSTPAAIDDSDNDGLTDQAEIDLGTDPNKADTDEDGLDDGAEVNTHGTDPKVKDSDGDGLEDGDEITNHLTEPDKYDSDNDGLSDGKEIELTTDPNLQDTDSDGSFDGDEYINGYDPKDINDFIPASKSILYRDEVSEIVVLCDPSIVSTNTTCAAIYNLERYIPASFKIGINDGDLELSSCLNSELNFFNFEDSEQLQEFLFIFTGETLKEVQCVNVQSGSVVGNEEINVFLPTRSNASTAAIFDTEYKDFSGEYAVVYPVGTDFTDSDGDGMPDFWETDNGLNPQSSVGDDGAEGDVDDDGLLNLFEYRLGTDPGSSDSDLDGLYDYDEVSLETNPNDNNSNSTLTSGDDSTNGLNDGDEDFDGDGFTNKEEITADTDPLDATSFPVTTTDNSGTGTDNSSGGNTDTNTNTNTDTNTNTGTITNNGGSSTNNGAANTGGLTSTVRSGGITNYIIGFVIFDLVLGAYLISSRRKKQKIDIS